MSKYVNVDKLIAEIERLIGVHTSKRGQDEVAMNLNYLKEFAISLQQEQPEVDLEEEIGHWMDKLDDKYCTRVEDYSVQDIKDTARYFHELGLNAARKEVDLEKEIVRYTKKYLLLPITHKITPMNIMESEWIKCAHHFYELGLKARKEE